MSFQSYENFKAIIDDFAKNYKGKLSPDAQSILEILTTGFKLKTGAIASTVAHDSHNIIVVGTNDKDIMVAINSMKKLGGGQLVVKNGKVIAHLAMPIAGLMSNKDIKTVVEENIKATKACYRLGVNKKIQPFMNMAFLSLPVIPELRLTTKGLVDVNQYKLVKLIV